MMTSHDLRLLVKIMLCTSFKLVVELKIWLQLLVSLFDEYDSSGTGTDQDSADQDHNDDGGELIILSWGEDFEAFLDPAVETDRGVFKIIDCIIVFQKDVT